MNRDYSNLKAGDYIPCESRTEMLEVLTEIAQLGITTEFCYELNGEQGLWLEVVEVEGK